MRGKKKVHATSVYRAVFYYWYRYILMVIQISYATDKQEDSKGGGGGEEESYSNIN